MAGKLTLPLQPTRRRLRNLVWIGLAILLLFVLLYGLSSLILLDSYTTLEDENANDITHVLLESIDHELWELDIFATQFANDPATQQYALDSNANYLQTNWQNNTFTNLNLNLALVIDNSGKTLFIRMYSPEDKIITTISLQDITSYLSEYMRLTQYVLADPSHYHTGIVLTAQDDNLVPGQAILFSVAPIHGTDGEPAGLLMLGRFLNATELTTVAQVTDTTVHFHYVDDPHIPASHTDLTQPGEIVTKTTDRNTYAAYTLLNDITGQPNLLLHIETPRDISAQGRTTINFFLLIVVISGVAIALGVFVWQEIDGMARIKSASSVIRQIGQSGDLDTHVPITDHHELGPLTESITEMLAMLRETSDERARALDAYTQQLAEERDLMRILIDNLSERVYIKDPLGRFVIANQALADLHGFPRAKDLIGKTDFDILSAETAQMYFDQEQALTRGEIAIIDQELPTETAAPVVSATGWTWAIKHPLTNRDGQIIGVVGISRDITTRKEMQDALRQAHDELEQRVIERTAELSTTNTQLQREIADRKTAQHALAASEQTTRAFQEKLKALHEISIELSALDSLDALYERAIILGRSELGFDRLGLWRLSADQTYMQSTFGTDSHGNLRDERDWIATSAEHPDFQQMMANTDRITIWEDREVLDGGQVVGHGWHVYAPLWNGTANIGWLSADNLIHQYPLEPYQAELLLLYGSTLGYLITQLENALALRISEARYSGLFNGMPVNLYRTARDGTFLAINPAMAQLMGFPDPATMQQTTVYDFYVSHTDRDTWLERIEREGIVRHFECQLRKPTGEIIWAEDTAHVVRNAQGEILYYEGSLTDITARKRTEHVLELAMTQVQTQANELATVSEISRQIATILDIDDLLWAICDKIQESFDIYYVQIYLLDEEQSSLILAAGAGETGRALVEHQHHIPLDSARGLVARAGRIWQPVVMNDVTRSIDFLPNVLLPKTRAELAIPMLVGTEFIGILDIQAEEIDRFNEGIIATKTALAVQVAIAIHNARLFTASSRRLAIIENSTDLIALADLETFTPTYINAAGLAMLGLPSSTNFRQHRLAEFYPPSTLRRFRHGILPIVQEHGIWRGENRIRRADGTEIPVEQTILTISAKTGEAHSIATITTDITERKLAEQALRRANRAYQAFSESNQAVVRATNDADLLADICDIIVETGGYRMAWAGIVHQETLDDILPIAKAGHEDGFLDLMANPTIEPFPSPVTLNNAIRSQHPIVIANIASDPTFIPLRAAALQRGYQSAIALPLVASDEVLGVLTVYADQAEVFDAQEIALLTELVNDLAYGITMIRTRDERHQIFQRLQANEANLSAVIENTDASIWSVNTNLELVTLNSTFRLLFKLYYQAELEPGMRMTDALPEPDRTHWQRLYDRALQGDFFRTEQTFNLPNLPAMHMEVSFNPIISLNNAVTGVNVFSRDITGRKQYEKMLESLNTELGERNDELYTLYDIGRQLAATLDPHTIYHLLFKEVVQKRLGAHTFFVSNYDPTTEMITCDFAIVDREEIDPAQLAPLPLGNGPQSQAIRTRQPHIIELPDDTSQVPGHYELIGDKKQPHSAIYVPLLSRETVNGVLYVQHQDAQAFDEADLNLLSTLANQVAIALQNARLFTGEHQQRLYAETLRDIAETINKTLNQDEVLAILFNTIQRLVPYDAVNIMLINQDGVARVAGGNSQIDRPDFEAWGERISFVVAENHVLSQASVSSESILVNDTHADPGWMIFPEVAWERAYACSRIMREGQVIGFLNVYSTQPNAFTVEHGRYLMAFAYQAGNAIRNAQLFTNAQEHIATLRAQATRLATINRVSGQIAQSMVVEEIYRITTHELQTALDVSFVGLILYADEDWGYLVMDTHPEAELYAQLPFPLADSPTVMYLRQTHRPLISAEALNDPLLEPTWDVLRARSTHSIMIVPLIVGNEVIGSVSLNCSEERHFSDADHEIAETIVNQAAVAITKAQLYTAERDQRRFAETLRDMAKVINNTLDFNRVLNNILQAIRRVVPHDAANIMLIEGDRIRIAHGHGYDQYGRVNQFENWDYALSDLPLIKAMMETGEPLFIADTAAEDEWIVIDPVDAWIRATLKIPIQLEDKIIGLLSLDNAQPDSFTPSQMERLQAFANQVATALQNAQLFATTQQHAIDQQEQAERLALINRTSAQLAQTLDLDELYAIILHELETNLGVDFSGLVLYENEEFGRLVVDTHPSRADIGIIVPLALDTDTHSVRYTRRARVSEDVLNDPHFANNREILASRGTQSLMLVPLAVGNSVIGSVGLDSTELRQFTDAECELAETIVNQAALAISKARLYTAERDQRRLAETLSDTAQTINQTLELGDVLDRVLENIQQAIPYDAANIMLFEDDELRVVRVAGYERYGTSEQTLELKVTLQNTAFGQHMLQSGEPYIRRDTHEEPDWHTRVQLNTWIRSVVHAPITVDGQIIGLLSLDSEQPNTYDLHHAERLQSFAHQAANAIRNARLFASEREQRALSDALRKTSAAVNSTLDFDQVLHNVLVNIGEVVAHEAASIMLIDEEHNEAYVVGSQGYQRHDLHEWVKQLRFPLDSTPNLKFVQTTNQPLITPDTHANNGWIDVPETRWIRSHATVPISRDNRVIGFLMLDSEISDFFTLDHIPPLIAFADQVAIAIQNAHLFTAERDQRELAEALRDTAQIISSTLDFDTVLDNLLDAVRRAMPHDAASIMLIDDDGIAHIMRSQGYERFVPQGWIDRVAFNVFEIPIWQQMLETGQPFAVPDVQNNPGWPKLPEEAWIMSSVKAPIKVDDQIIGILHLDSTTLGAFDQEDAERLQAFADQAALAIRNAQLFQAEHKQRTQAEALRDITNALTGSVHLSDVGQNILEIVARIVPHDAANIMVIDRDKNVTRTVGSWGYVQQGHATEKDGLEFSLDYFTHKTWQDTLRIPDTQTHEGWVDLPGDEWIRSYVGAPIRLQNETIGLLNLDSATPNFYTEEHSEQLRAFTDQIAVAIQTAQLFEATQRHAAELEDRVEQRTQELNQQSSQLQAILDSMSEGVIYDEKLIVKYINSALTRLTGYGPDDFAHYLAELYRTQLSSDEYQTLEAKIYKRVEQRGLWSDEAKLRRKDGSEFDATLTVTRVVNDDNATVGAVTVIRDVSQEKALQEQKDRFIANASHELRTPLANIKTRLYLLQKQPTKAARHLSILNQVSDNMAELIENLLDVSRFERGVIPLHRHNLALQTVVEEVTTIQQADAEAKEITLEFDLHADPLIVWVDRQRITQVFTNLVANAINYTQLDGRITVELHPVTLDDQPGVEVRVSDTGIGIKADLIDHVFEPFFRADEQAAVGTGLGLTIAHDIIRLHEGDIRVESEYGIGSTFIVWLPLTPSLDEPEETFTL